MESLSLRLQKVESELRQIIGEFLSTKCIFGNVMITLVRVHPAGDLRSAKVFVSFFGGTPEEQDEAFEELEERRPLLQSHVAKNLPMKFCPKLKFYKDTTMEHTQFVHQVLKDEESSS